MDKCIVYVNEMGSVSVMGINPRARRKLPLEQAAGDDDAQFRDETDDEFIARVAGRCVPVRLIAPPPGMSPLTDRGHAVKHGLAFVDVPFHILPVASIPDMSDLFFDAWTLKGGAVVVDMIKARDVHRRLIRQRRQPLLDALDVEYQRADERGAAGLAQKAAIALRKQELRDLPQAAAIEAAVEPEQLKAAWPAVLKPNPYVKETLP